VGTCLNNALASLALFRPSSQIAMMQDQVKDDSRMPKVLKEKRRKAKKRTKATTSTKAKTQKIQKKTKIETTTMRVSQPLKLPNKVKRDEPRPTVGHAAAIEKKTDQLDPAVLPNISYKLEVDGRLKSEYPTQEAAMTVALELKRKFPQIRVAIVDTNGQTRIAVESSQAAA